jgi:hypothetical protein
LEVNLPTEHLPASEQSGTFVFLQRMLRIGFFLVLLLPSIHLAGQNIVVRGILTDEESGEAVSFAHIGICGKSIGTVSNEKGTYDFYIPDYLRNDTLCASAIGYETFRIPINSIRGLANFNIRLKPQTSVLGEVIIRDERITARRVIEKAVNRIPKNYPSGRHYLEGYYRDYLKKENEYISFLEGAFIVQDPGFRRPVSQSKIQIRQLRHNRQYLENFDRYIYKLEEDSTRLLIHGIMPSFEGNEFSNMLYHDPVRNHALSVPFVGVFDEFYQRNYDFRIAYYTVVDGAEVYVIDIAPIQGFRFTHVDIKGRLFIRTDNFAIVKFHYAYFVTKRLETKKLYEINLEYREIGDRMYLKYISFMNYFKIMTLTEIADLYFYREFFVNNMTLEEDQEVVQIPFIDPKKPLYQQNAPNEPSFWIGYNRLLLEQPLLD